MAAKKKKKGAKKHAKKKGAKRHHRRANGAAKLGLQVKHEGKTADNKAGIYRGYLKGHGGRVDLGVVTAPDVTSARRKLASIARSLTK